MTSPASMAGVPGKSFGPGVEPAPLRRVPSSRRKAVRTGYRPVSTVGYCQRPFLSSLFTFNFSPPRRFPVSPAFRLLRSPVPRSSLLPFYFCLLRSSPLHHSSFITHNSSRPSPLVPPPPLCPHGQAYAISLFPFYFYLLTSGPRRPLLHSALH